MHDTRDTYEPSSEAHGPPPARSPGCGSWIVIAVAVLLVMGPLLGGGLNHELARWRIAAGLEEWLNENLSAAVAALDRAAETAPDYPRIYELRSQWRLYAGDYAGALADAQRLLELAPHNAEGYRLQADALVYLRRPAEAVETWLKFAEREKEQRGAIQAVTLNGVAYFRALAQSDLDTALEEINQAIKRLGADPALLDTRGYIQYLRKEYEAALEDMDPAVIAAERQRNKLRTEQHTLVGLSVKDPRAVAWEMKLIDRNVAVIRYHRGLLFEALGRTAEAERDFRRVRELGHEPGPALF